MVIPTLTSEDKALFMLDSAIRDIINEHRVGVGSLTNDWKSSELIAIGAIHVAKDFIELGVMEDQYDAE